MSTDRSFWIRVIRVIRSSIPASVLFDFAPLRETDPILSDTFSRKAAKPAKAGPQATDRASWFQRFSFSSL